MLILLLDESAWDKTNCLFNFVNNNMFVLGLVHNIKASFIINARFRMMFQ